MFWKKKQKKKEPPKPTREEIIAQAKKNARIAKENIGEETLARIRSHIEQKQNNPLDQAIAKIKAMDNERIADNIRAIYRDE